jgi:hypothetical protein
VQAVVDQKDIFNVAPGRRARRDRQLGAVAQAHEGVARVWKPVEVEVVVIGRELVEALDHLVQGHLALDPQQPERGHGPQRHLRDDAERAEAHTRGPPRVGVALHIDRHRRAVGPHQLERVDLRGEVSQQAAGAVGSRRRRAGDRLLVDITQVLECEAAGVKHGVQLADRDSGLDRDETRPGVDLQHPVDLRERHERPIRGDERGERVARAGHPHRLPRLAGAA